MIATVFPWTEICVLVISSIWAAGGSRLADDPAPEPLEVSGRAREISQIDHVKHHIFVLKQPECTLWREPPVESPG